MHHADEVMRRAFEVCTVETVTPEVLYLLKRYDYEDLLVVNNMRDRRIVGLIHAEDVSDNALKTEEYPFELTAKHFMDSPPPSVTRKESIADCLRLMNENSARILPVLDEEGNCVGLLKKSDLVRFNE